MDIVACEKYIKKNCTDWTRSELIDFFIRLGQPYNNAWSNKKLCQELDSMCQLLGIIPILAPKPTRQLPLVNPNLESYLDKIAQAQAKDRQQLATYCKELQKIKQLDLYKSYYRNYLIEVDKFVKRIIQHYQIDAKKLKPSNDISAIIMNCEFLKQALA